MNTKYADRITPTFKKELWKRHFNDRNDGECKICNGAIHKNIFTWKYIFPKSRGGQNNILNLLPVCSQCDTQYSKLGDEINLISFLKNKHNITVELDDEYRQYQHTVIYYYSKAYNTGTFLNYIKPDRVQAILPVIKYLISNNLYNPKWTLQEFCDFINMNPECKNRNRRLKLHNIIINDIEYSDINIRYSILGSSSENSVREMSYSLTIKSTEFLAGCFISGWMYYPKTRIANSKYCKDIETIIQSSQYQLIYRF